MTTSKFTYRNDIDGLRALAVLLVLVAHLKVPLVQGGFIGVDVFFVISGYLITSILKKELETGSFSIPKFYLRRVKRILPALFFMIAGTSVACFAVLFPSDLQVYAQSAFASATAWSNIFFANIQGGYWGKNVAAMPLAHMWSLAVEEQFYFIWPVVFYAGYHWCSKKYQRGLILTALLLMFALSVALSRTDTGYYSLVARAFEIFLGCAVSLGGNSLMIRKKQHSALASVLGVGFIVLAACILEDNAVFPGFNALLPCLGAALLIMPKEHGNIVTAILESAPVTFVGRISYSLYLWHWPLIALATYRNIPLQDVRWQITAATFLLAIVSYYFVEQPVRRSKAASFVLVKRHLLIPVTAIWGFVFIVVVTEGASFRFSTYDLSVITAVAPENGRQYPECDAYSQDGKLVQLDRSMCYWGENAGPDNVDVLLLGDSHAVSMRGFVEVLSEDAHLNGLQITASGAAYLPGVRFYKEQEHVRNKEHNDNVTGLIRTSSAQYVVLSGRYNIYVKGSNEADLKKVFFRLSYKDEPVEEYSLTRNAELFQRGLEAAVTTIIQAGKTPVLFKDTPEMREDLTRASVNVILDNAVDTGFVSSAYIAERSQPVENIIDSLANKYPQVIVVDPKELMCREGKCFSYIDDVPLYFDDDHLNYKGSRYLGKRYIEALGNPLLRKNAVQSEVVAASE